MEFKIKDINIYYEIHGKGTPVVMIHGWGPDHRLMKGCMEPIFKSIKDSYKRIYFDLPGMGKTNSSSWITGSDQMLEIITNFINDIIPGENYLLAGESYGGYLSRGLINKYSSKINGLLLICPLTRPYIPTENGMDKGNVPDLTVLEKDETFLKKLNEDDRKYFQGINVIQNEKIWKRFKPEVLEGLKIADNNFLDNCLGQNTFFSFDVDKLDKPFDKPSLIIMGRQDVAVGYRDQYKFLENFSRASYIILDKAGHNLQIEQDTLFNALVKEWLERVKNFN